MRTFEVGSAYYLDWWAEGCPEDAEAFVVAALEPGEYAILQSADTGKTYIYPHVREDVGDYLMLAPTGDNDTDYDESGALLPLWLPAEECAPADR